MSDQPTSSTATWEFNLDSWNMAEKWAFFKAPEEESVAFLVKVTKQTPLPDFDPTNPADYGKLSQLQYDEVVKRFLEALKSRRV